MSTKKKPFNRDAYISAKNLATEVTGYDSNSPIWGKRLPEVLELIDTHINNGQEEMNAGNYATAEEILRSATFLIDELKKRLAKQAIVSKSR